MYTKIAKCRFAMRCIDYLDYTVSAEGISPSPDNVESVRICPEKLLNDTQAKHVHEPCIHRLG